MTMTQPIYDAQVIHDSAARLYRRAKSLSVDYAVIGVIVGAMIGFFVLGVDFGWPGMILTVVFGAIGYFLGIEGGVRLRVQAQTALCQASIEENTRR